MQEQRTGGGHVEAWAPQLGRLGPRREIQEIMSEFWTVSK